MATIVKANAEKKPGNVGFLVKCPGCGGLFHETTEWFDSMRPANGTMFTLLPMYGASGANWQSFPYQEEIKFDALTCPGCGCSYTQGGSFVTVVPKDDVPGVDAQALDLALHLEYKDMVDQGNFTPITPEELAAAESGAPATA